MNQIEKKAAEWDGVVDAVQDSSSRRERLEKRLIYLNDYLQKYDDVSEQIYNNFSKEFAEIEEELGKLGGWYIFATFLGVLIFLSWKDISDSFNFDFHLKFANWRV